MDCLKKVDSCGNLKAIFGSLRLRIQNRNRRLYSVIKFVRRILAPLFSILEISKINIQDFTANPPIIIYQMGKVGSSTVFKSLKNADLPNPIYQVHFLSWDGIKNAEEYFLCLDLPIRAEHIERSKLLRKKMSKSRGGGGGKLLLW